MKKWIIILSFLLIPTLAFAGDLQLEKQKLLTLQWKKAALQCRIGSLNTAITDIDKDMKSVQAEILKLSPKPPEKAAVAPKVEDEQQ